MCVCLFSERPPDKHDKTVKQKKKRRKVKKKEERRKEKTGEEIKLEKKRGGKGREEEK